MGGYDRYLVTVIARRDFSSGVDEKTLQLAVQKRMDDEVDCPICSLSFADSIVMMHRPCCKQAICLACNDACHGENQACAFCRGEPEAAEEDAEPDSDLI